MMEEKKALSFSRKEPCLSGWKKYSSILDEKLDQVQKAMEQELQSITLEDVREDLKNISRFTFSSAILHDFPLSEIRFRMNIK